MQRQITQRQLRNDSGEIMRALDAGESVILTRNGTPVGEITPLRRRYFVAKAAALRAFRNAPTIALHRLRSDLDAVAEQTLTPRA